MPGMDGIELYKRMRALQPGTVAVFLTSFHMLDTLTIYPEVVAAIPRVLAKLVDSRELVPLVEQLAGRP